MDTRRNDSGRASSPLKWAGLLIAVGVAIFLLVAFVAFNNGGY